MQITAFGNSGHNRLTLDGIPVDAPERFSGASYTGFVPSPEAVVDNALDAESLYSKLESVILPMFYEDRTRYLSVMQHAIAINGSFFNTQRMVQQYITDAYLR